MRRSVLVALTVAALLAACSDTDTPAAAPGTTTAEATTTTVDATTTTGPDAPDEGYAVGRRSIELVDTTRPSAADPARDLPEERQRTFPVLLLYPADGDPSGAGPTDDLAAAAGPFPLVVFTHGVTATGPAYQARLQQWARAGYVVAAPTYPRSSGPGGQIADYVNQPADVSFVLDELLALPADDPLAAAIDPDRLAAAGHSLGAITTLGVGLSSCCADDRLDAAVAISGIRLPFPGGEFDDLTRVPLLLIHGAEDGVVPVAGSDSIFEETPGPAHYLRLPDGDHTGFLATDGALVDRVAIAFLDRYVRDVAGALDGLPDEVAATGRATFASKGA